MLGKSRVLLILVSNRMDIDIGSKKVVDCRICHDEDEDSNMEVPCSCSGTLKVNHTNLFHRICFRFIIFSVLFMCSDISLFKHHTVCSPQMCAKVVQ